MVSWCTIRTAFRGKFCHCGSPNLVSLNCRGAVSAAFPICITDDTKSAIATLQERIDMASRSLYTYCSSATCTVTSETKVICTIWRSWWRILTLLALNYSSEKFWENGAFVNMFKSCSCRCEQEVIGGSNPQTCHVTTRSSWHDSWGLARVAENSPPVLKNFLVRRSKYPIYSKELFCLTNFMVCASHTH